MSINNRTCRSCNHCNICGRTYLKRLGQVCKWIDPSNDSYGFDCDELACPQCRYCCFGHCTSDNKLIQAHEIRKKDYIRATNEIGRRLNRRKREYVRSITETISNFKNI